MGVKQKNYKREEFIDFMKKYGVGDDVISNFVGVPETIIKNGDKYYLTITTKWYDIGKTYYEFELNYYSSKLMEYLFSLKIYYDVEVSVIHLVKELKKSGYLK